MSYIFTRYLKTKMNSMDETSNCNVKCTKSFCGKFIFDSVGNKVIRVLDFLHILPKGSSFLESHELVLKYEWKNSENIVNLTLATPAERGKHCPCPPQVKKAHVFVLLMRNRSRASANPLHYLFPSDS